MKNKKLWFKIGVSLAFIGGISLSITSATRFNIDLKGKLEVLSETDFQRNIMSVHFADNGNDFGGFIYLSNGLGEAIEGDGDFEVKLGESASWRETYNCKKQVKGFYYNAERGERLWPLDASTLSELTVGLTTTGGLYSRCSMSGYDKALNDCASESSEAYDECVDEVNNIFKADEYGYYGALTHVYSGQTFVLVSGVEYDTGGNKFVSIKSGSTFSPTFIRYGNKYPVGFVYDFNGGIGLVGCRIQDPTNNSIRDIIDEMKIREGKIANLFVYSGAEEGIIYTGNKPNNVVCGDVVWDSILGLVIEGIVGMGEGSEFEVIGNQRDNKMQYFSSASVNAQTLFNYARKKSEILCRGKWDVTVTSNTGVVCRVGNTNGNGYKNKTLIVKNGDVIINPESSDTSTDYYDIFINGGNLVIDETDASKFVFTTGGFISRDTMLDFSNAVTEAKGNYSGNNASIGSFIRGNFIVDGYIMGSAEDGLKNKYFVYGKISTKDDFNSLSNTFQWRCNNGEATDGTVCPPSLKGGEWNNPYERASLVIIDQNYDSTFFNA